MNGEEYGGVRIELWDCFIWTPLESEDMMKIFNSAEKMQKFASFMNSERNSQSKVEIKLITTHVFYLEKMEGRQTKIC